MKGSNFTTVTSKAVFKRASDIKPTVRPEPQRATIWATKLIGDWNTRYGTKKNTVEWTFETEVNGALIYIKENFPCTLKPCKDGSPSNFFNLIVGVGMNPKKMRELDTDTDTLIGKSLNVIVYYAGDVLHIKPIAQAQV
jgi:hypothetical protein